MALGPKAATDLADTLLEAFDRQHKIVKGYDRFIDGSNDAVRVPYNANSEVLELAQLSATSYGSLAISGLAQQLIVGGFRMEDGSPDEDAETHWQRNRMQSRQNALHRGVLSHGEAYVVATLGTDQLTGRPMPKYELYGADRMALTYADQAQDEWPLYSIRETKLHDGKGVRISHIILTDDEGEYWFGVERNVGNGAVAKIDFIEFRPFALQLGINPVVRYSNVPNLHGHSRSDLHHLIPVIRRIDQTEFDRLITQRFASFRARWIAGIEIPDDDAKQREARTRLLREALMIFEDPDVKTGSLDATDLTQFAAMREDQLKTFVSLGQIPPHLVLGLEANLSAEALEAANEASIRKRQERQLGYGESHLQLSRLGHALMGNADKAANYKRSTHWEDVDVRSLAQTADALGKLATMLGVPPRGLWARIPGTTAQDLANWETLAGGETAIDKLASTLLAQATQASDVAAVHPAEPTRPPRSGAAPAPVAPISGAA